MKRIVVNLPYIQDKTSICIGRNLNELIYSKLSPHKKDILFIVSKSTFAINKDLINQLSSQNAIVVEMTEDNKNIFTFEKLLTKCYEKSLSRKGTIVGIGGGIVGDFVGFLAASYRRGISFVYIPTTLTAQSDGVINKTGLNTNGIKNLIGSYYSPKMIFCDISYIEGLSESAINFGMSEIIKHALIKSTNLIKILKQYSTNNITRRKYNWTELIYESLKIKTSLIENDPYEQNNIQKGLNYGHTFAHALEDYFSFQFPHGYAVAIGIKTAGYISNALGILSDKDLKLQNELLKLTNLDLYLPPNFDIKQYIMLLKRSKKKNLKISLILLEKIGNYRVYSDINEDLVNRVIYKHLLR